MHRISKVFVANRGEIAVRVITACRDLGIQCVLGVSAADGSSLAAEMADRVVCIGPPRPADSYLKIDAIVHAAKMTGCDALHPGYGFLAERSELAQTCQAESIAFVGPSAECIRNMGDKLFARRVAEARGIPVIPGTGKLDNVEDAIGKADLKSATRS